jgi:hypothetical protein
MGSVKGETKQVSCSICGEIFTGSKFASPKTAKCPKCKKVRKAVGGDQPKPVVYDASVQAMSDAMNTKPVSIILKRNRSEIEGEVVLDTGEIIDRIPAKWKIIDNVLDYVSISKMDTYSRCPFRFHEQYMEHKSNKDSDNGNIFTWFGSILHGVMDKASTAWVDSGITLNPLALYDDEWKAQSDLTDPKMYKEGRQLISEYFKAHPIGADSYKTIVTELEWRGKFSEIFDDVPDELKDMQFGCQFDYIGEIDSETAILKDYKSNRHPYTQMDLADSIQLQVYEIIARKLYPQYKTWITGYELFRFGWQQCPQRSEEDLYIMSRYVINTATQILHDSTWKQRLNDFCGYCQLKPKCEEYCDFVNDPQRKIDTIRTDMTDMESINSCREQYTTFEKILKGRKDELANIIKKNIEQATINGEKCVIGDKELYLQAQSRPTYNYSAVRNIMAVAGKMDELEKCTSISKTKLDAIAKKDPTLAMQLLKCIEEGFSSPYIMSKKKK